MERIYGKVNTQQAGLQDAPSRVGMVGHAGRGTRACLLCYVLPYLTFHTVYETLLHVYRQSDYRHTFQTNTLLHNEPIYS